MIKEAILYEKLKNNNVRCQVCQHYCVIAPGKRECCQSRENKDGKLYTLIYGLLHAGIQIDPIEKKPMYHFYPGTQVASIGSFGCNFRCKQCLNYHCSYGYDLKKIKSSKSKDQNYGNFEIDATPKQIISEIKKGGYPGIAFTYNEPTIWLEFMYDCAKLACEEGLYTVMVTNGYISKEALDKIGQYINGYAVDFKGFSKESYTKQGGFFGQIPEMTKRAKEKWGMQVEITTLVIPGINDAMKELKRMTSWIKKELGVKTPWHLSQYSPDLAPDLEFRKIPATSIETLKKVYQLGKENGLEFVYVWAPSTFPHFSISDTICPKCGEKIIDRSVWSAKILNLKKDKCGSCQEDLNVVN